jgi:hypothetical protein
VEENGRFETLVLVPAARAVCRATVGQEYFYFLEKQDGDPRAFVHSTVILLDGPLDRDRLARCAARVIERHTVYRTVLEDRGGQAGDQIVQRVRSVDEVAPPMVELVDRRAVPESEWRTACTAIADERAASGFSPDQHLARAVIVTFADAHHALVLLFHHVVNDGGSLETFVKELFEDYGGQERDVPLHYIDYAAALEAWAETEQGRAQQARWAAALAGAQPLALPVDHPRDELDALRARAPRGIVAETMHPVQHVALPAATVAAVGRIARRERTSPFAVYLAALAAVLADLTGQDDICIESSYSPRFNLRLHRRLGPVHGLVTSWTIARVRLGGATTFTDRLRRARQTANDIQELGAIWRYYETVPVELRRAVFNYVPMSPPSAEIAPGLQSARLSPGFPIWKRPWELHLTVVDSRSAAQLFWTCNARLFSIETTRRLLDAFRDHLERGTLESDA